MTGGAKNFGNKINSNGLDKNPQNIHRKGRPKKGISLVNKQLEEAGYSPATKQEIETNYMSLLNLEEEKLIELGQDKSQPMIIRILIKNMLGGKGFEIIEKMLDRGIGKPSQTLQQEISGEITENISFYIPNNER